MHIPNKLKNILFATGALLLLIGAATYITGWQLSPYIYIVGACCFSSMQLLDRYEGQNPIVIRLRRQQILAAFLILLTSVPMLMNFLKMGFAQRNEWIVCLAVAAILELYTAFRIPSELEKDKA